MMITNNNNDNSIYMQINPHKSMPTDKVILVFGFTWLVPSSKILAF